MLQQTRVAAVLEHYRLFLKRFPNVRTLAAASESEVLAAWSGLGYYRRARMARHCAQKIVADHRSRFPRSSEALQTLPGIGRYTAAAIASIAFAEPVAVVDGNVERVLQRLAGSSLTSKDMWQRAQSFLDESRPGDFNQAMMELGATRCTPKQPKCDSCPLRKWCATQGETPHAREFMFEIRQGGTTRRKPSSGGASQLNPALQRGLRKKNDASPGGTAHASARMRPRSTDLVTRGRFASGPRSPQPQTRQNKKEIWCVLDHRDGHVRLVQRSSNASLMAAMWELPQWPQPARQERGLPPSPTAAKRRKTAAHSASRGSATPNRQAPKGRKKRSDAPWRTFRHSITVTDYTVHVIRAAAPVTDGKWIPVAKLSDVPITGLTRKILKAGGVI